MTNLPLISIDPQRDFLMTEGERAGQLFVPHHETAPPGSEVMKAAFPIAECDAQSVFIFGLVTTPPDFRETIAALRKLGITRIVVPLMPMPWEQ